MSHPELHQLLQVLEERHAGLSSDDVAWRFDSLQHSADAAAWVREHLSQDTLLTSEELAFTQNHSASTVEKEGTTRPVTDQEFEEALKFLEASTASIEKQCKLLEEQRNALRGIRARSGQHPELQSSAVERNARLAREKKQLEFEVSELEESLQTRLEQTLRESNVSAASVQSGIERLLERDDRLLDGLERLLPQIAGANTSLGGSQEIDHLCQALVAQSNAEIHARIDNAFLASAHVGVPQTNGLHPGSTSGENAQQATSLRIELEELCREIDGLSSMTVDNVHRIPIVRALRQAMADVEIEKTVWLEHLAGTLHYLTARLQVTEDHTQNTHARDGALRTLSRTVQHLQAISTSPSKPMKQASNAQSPAKLSQNGLKPLRLVQANLSESQDPTFQLMRHFDVLTRDSSDVSKLATNLRQAFLEKHEKLATLSSNSRQSASVQLGQLLARLDNDVNALLGAVFDHSAFGSVKVVSSMIEDDLKRLESSTQEMGHMMRKTDVLDLVKTVEEKKQVILDQLGS